MTITQERSRSESQATPIRALMSPNARYTVPTRLLAVAAAHAAADAISMGEPVAPRVDALIAFHNIATPGDISIGAVLARRLRENSPRSADELLEAAFAVLGGKLGQRVGVLGWLPGQLTCSDGDHRRLAELTGTLCPQCGANPVCHGADRTRLRCLNSEECGWESRPRRAK